MTPLTDTLAAVMRVDARMRMILTRGALMPMVRASSSPIERILILHRRIKIGMIPITIGMIAIPISLSIAPDRLPMSQYVIVGSTS